jgi:hypothetical protein
MFMDELQAKLLELGWAYPDEIVGWTPEEIAQAEENLGVRLPHTYKEFLSGADRRGAQRRR